MMSWPVWGNAGRFILTTTVEMPAITTMAAAEAAKMVNTHLTAVAIGAPAAAGRGTAGGAAKEGAAEDGAAALWNGSAGTVTATWPVVTAEVTAGRGGGGGTSTGSAEGVGGAGGGVRTAGGAEGDGAVATGAGMAPP
ncbi:hypothetical protein GCM10017673_18450 [Streptosporangium violaceochromogenes]|nr:hypothetical protein GCM10017673_18450 [Streptosporangium violaceochromogenes]